MRCVLGFDGEHEAECVLMDEREMYWRGAVGASNPGRVGFESLCALQEAAEAAIFEVESSGARYSRCAPDFPEAEHSSSRENAREWRRPFPIRR